MRENVKNVGLILALIIAGVSLPTSIMSFTNRPTTPITEVNNYYYNTTIIEQYNITIIEQYNNTIVYNNTVYEFTNQTLDFYHFTNIVDTANFLNLTYNITKDSLLLVYETFITYNHNPTMEIYKDSVIVIPEQAVNHILPYICKSGFYELKFYNHVPPPNSNFSICISIWS